MLLIEEKRLGLIKSESIKKNNKRKANYVKIAKPYKRPHNYRDVCNYVYYIAFSHLQESTKVPKWSRYYTVGCILGIFRSS